MRRLLALAAIFLTHCGAPTTHPEVDAGASNPQAEAPPAICEPVALYDISVPTTVVGDGTPASCTTAALQAAADRGGTIVFDCGPGPTTLQLTSPILIAKETVLDGKGLVTLSGGDTTRILYLDSQYDLTTPRLVVQRMTFRNARSAAGGDDTAVGGGAIYREGGNLTVIDSHFLDNQAPPTGQDVAGGAIYGFGGGDIVISGSTFTGNSASNGGAIGSLNGDVTIINSTFTENAATGTDGNPGNGGAGGAIYMDGSDERTSVCGTVIRNNEAGAIGGGFFRVSNTSDGTFAMDRSTVDSNRVTPTDKGNAGGLYLQGLAIALTNSIVSRNRAFHNGGLWLNDTQVELTNVTVAENVAFGTNGGGLWVNATTGTCLNCTIASNHSTGTDKIAGAIFGEGLTLKNTIVAGNTAMWTKSCNATHGAGATNLQWPDDGAPCTEDPLYADPMIGGLGSNGGDTETILPASTSPARRFGTGCPSYDQRGEARSEPCTAGAVEIP